MRKQASKNTGPRAADSSRLSPMPQAWPGPRRQGVAEVAGPSWLTGAFAAVMTLTGCYSASRLVLSRLHEPATEAAADGLHAVMGTAMAGMPVPQLDLLPAGPGGSPGPVHARLHHVDHRRASLPGPGRDHHTRPDRSPTAPGAGHHPLWRPRRQDGRRG
jgi:hypothetical protein